MFPKSIKRLFYHPDMTQCIWAFRIKTCLPGNLKYPNILTQPYTFFVEYKMSKA